LFPASGQNGVVDSLKAVLSSPQADSSRVYTLIELSSQYYRSDPAEAKRLGEEAKELAEKIGFDEGRAYAYKSIGMGYYFENNWIDALVNWRLALESFEAAGDMNGVSNMLNNLGAVHFNGGDDEPALNYYLESLKVAEKTGDSLRIVTALVNIGSVYLNKVTHHDLAFDYYKRALPLSIKLGDLDAIGTCAVNMGEIFLNEANLPDSALYYFELALDAYQKSATGNVAFALKSIGRVYAERGEYNKAIQYQTDAYNLAKNLDGRLEMAQSLLSLASTYELKGDIREAIDAFNQAKELAYDIGASYEVKDAYLGLAESYARISDFKNAYTYQTLFSSVKDTLYNAEMDKKLQAQTLSYEIDKKQDQISLLEKDQELKALELERQKTIRNATGVVGLLLLILMAGLLNRYLYTKKTSRIIALEKDRSDRLLLNILPSETAEELKTHGSATPKYYDVVSVLFTDFKGFTNIAEKLTPHELVEELNNCFIAFDMIIDKYKLEKIKTIGDAYMCAGGIPAVSLKNPVDMVSAALEIRDFMENLRKEREALGKEIWELRIGIHTGPVVAGVVGKNKFAYDIWGDAVNTASRMESSGIPGAVNISGTTYEHIKGHFKCTHRGKIQAKNKGEIDMYIVDWLNSDKINEQPLVA
jgi:class 3 adenylate cyclase/tetratricopeptide (TPR) repeat protein